MGFLCQVGSPGLVRTGPACPHSPAGGPALRLLERCDATPCDSTICNTGEDERDKAKSEMQLAKRGCQEAEEAPLRVVRSEATFCAMWHKLGTGAGCESTACKR